jgi:integrase
MNKKQLFGIYAPYIKELIELKRGLGFKYETEETIYSIFDRFTIQKSEKVVGITKELAEGWCKINANESGSYRKHRMICLSQLSSYLCKIGIQSYIPQIPVFKPTFTPYIFSHNEINAIFCAADQLRAKKKHKKTILFPIPVLMRFLYATGARISEALSLKDNDINLEDNFFILRDCKNGKERMLPISQTLTTVCKEYIAYRDKLPIYREKNGYFFISCNGSVIKTDAVYRKFRAVLKEAGINFIGEHRGPRIHDLRHTFSVHSLAMMASSGMDMYCSLPILSGYLGHQSLESTNCYVRLTAEMYPELMKDVDRIYLDVFPNFENYESN